MANREEMDYFLESLFEDALVEHKEVKKEQIEQNQLLTNNLLEFYISANEREVVEDCLFEIALFEEKKAGFVYRRGLKDCVFILKELGVLA